MSNAEKKTAIREALRSLGYTNAQFWAVASSPDRAELYVNGEYFGVFDYTRKTFVD